MFDMNPPDHYWKILMQYVPVELPYFQPWKKNNPLANIELNSTLTSALEIEDF